MTDIASNEPDNQALTGRVISPDPGSGIGSFVDAAGAARELERLRGTLRRTYADIVVWVVRGGPTLCGYETARRAVADLLDVKSSQVQRVMDYVLVVERLAAAAGVVTVDEVRSIASATSAGPASTYLKPQLPDLVDEITQQARREDADPETLIQQLIPRIIDTATRSAKAELAAAPSPNTPREDRSPSDEDAELGVETRLPAESARPRAEAAPQERSDVRAVSVCPHCGGELPPR